MPISLVAAAMNPRIAILNGSVAAGAGLDAA
jgi:hypothetical protein